MQWYPGGREVIDVETGTYVFLEGTCLTAVFWRSGMMGRGGSRDGLRMK
jgi:hypothetical protein